MSAVPLITAHVLRFDEVRPPINQLKPVCDSPFIHAELSRAADTELCTQYAVETFGTARLVPCDAPVQIPQALYTAAAPITSTPFQPHVMIFDPVVNGALFADGGGTVTPSAVALTCAHSFDELISTLTSKYVINASTIKDWMRTDLTMLQSMSPNDFARILECVTNVLDQVSVCYELARCLGHAHLTCAHISAACSVCPYAVTEVAVAMVPFVGDVHYIGAVMDWLPVYEQPRVTSRLRLD